MTEFQPNQTILAGSESGAYEKLIAALRHASEAARAGRFSDVTDNLRRGVEASAELGTYLSVGRWALVGRALDATRVTITGLGSAVFNRSRKQIAGQLDEMRTRIVRLRHGGVVH